MSDKPPGNEPFLRPYEGYVRLTIRGREFEVPEGQKVLRIYQYLSEDFDIDVARFCWNDDCHTCAFRFVGPNGRRRTALGCQKTVFDGMEVLTVPGGVRVRETAGLEEEDPEDTELSVIPPTL